VKTRNLVPLGDFIEQIRGVSYKPSEIRTKSEEDYLPILRASNFDEEGLNTKGLIYIHKSRINENQLIKAGDILIASSSGSKEVVGKSIQFKEDFHGSFGAFCKLIRVKQGFATGYVGHFFKSKVYKNAIRKSVQGANINNLRNEHIDSLQIPRPSIADQIRIDNILSRAELLIHQRKESLRLLDEFLKSTFLEMFGDPVKNERNLKQVRLDALGVWKSGGTPSRANSNYFHGNIPWITSGELNEMYISDSKEKITEEAIENSNADLIMPGSILLGMYDTAALKSSINTTIATCNQAIAYSKLNSDLCNTVFIYFNIQLGRDYFRRQQRGVRQKNMNLSMIKSIKVLLPGLDEQIKFARIVERTQIIKAECLASLQELKNLHASLSERAFRDRLTVIDKHLTNAAHQEGMYHRIGR
jgi:type I restriction enzyme S subunit